VLGGIGGDTLTVNDTENVGAGRPDSRNIVIGDSGYIDWTAGDVSRVYAATTFARNTLSGDDTNALDIDRIFSTEPNDGGNDTITTGNADDLIVGGQGADTIAAGNGDNLVFGDNGQVTAATSDANRFTSWTITLGLVETIQSLIGGADSITTGTGTDILLGGIGGDTLNAGEGRNIVLGDSGYIDWTARDLGRFYAAFGTPARATLAGDDVDATDIDRIFSTEPTDGGNDTITTGAADDLVIGGQASDTINAGNGNNIVFGDSGQISAAVANAPQFSSLPVTLGLLTSIATDQGGNDVINTGSGRDIIVGGMANDTINAGNADNIIIGDNGFIDWTALERPYVPVLAGDDTDPSDIDRISTMAPTHGGADSIVSGDGYDLIFGGTAGDTIYAGAGNDLVFGDHGKAEATLGGGVIARNLPLSTLAKSFTFTSIDVLDVHLGGPDTIYGEDGQNIIIGGQASDSIFGGNLDDDLIGGHTVAGGYDAGDIIDGRAGNDVIAVDNALILRRGDGQSR